MAGPVSEVEEDPPLSLRDAYKEVYDTVKQNAGDVGDRNDAYGAQARALTESLPHPSKATPLEMRAIFSQVVDGTLEWAFQLKTRRTYEGFPAELGNFCRTALEMHGGRLHNDEVENLSKRPIFPYTNYAPRDFDEVDFPPTEKSADSVTRKVIETENDVPSEGDRDDGLVTEDGAPLTTEAGEPLVQEGITAKGSLSVEKEPVPFTVKAENESGQEYKLFRKAGRHYFMKDAKEGFEPVPEIPDDKEVTFNKNGIPLLRTIRGNKSHRGNQENEVSLESGPTPKVITDRWVSEDTLGYMPFARSIASLITHPETSPPLTLAIKAPWGAGKTSIMRMVQQLLDSQSGADGHASGSSASAHRGSEGIQLRDIIEDNLEADGPTKLPDPKSQGHQRSIPPRHTVWFDAWKYQTDEQVWAGLAHCIVTQVTQRMTPKERERFWARINARRSGIADIQEEVRRDHLWSFLPKLSAYVVAVVSTAAATWTLDLLTQAASMIPWSAGAALSAAIIGVGTGHFKKDKEKALDRPVSEVYPDLVREPEYNKRVGYLHHVDADMRDVLQLVASPESPLVVFIDDLDRCTPNQVAQVVEAIHLFLAGDFPDCIFVLGLEPGVVAAAIEVHYQRVVEKAGEIALQSDTTSTGWRFMEKIVQLPLVIPPPTQESLERFVDLLLAPPEEEAEDLEEVKEPAVKQAMNEFSEAKTVADVDAKAMQLLGTGSKKEREAKAEASLRTYSATLTERDPVIRAFCLDAAKRFGANPRQIKRYLNQFRLLSLIRFAIRVEARKEDRGEPDLPPDDVLTKYVILSTEWPQAIDCIGQNFVMPDGEERELMDYLEETAEGLTSKSPGDADEEWEKALKSTKLNFNQWGHSRRFRSHLATKSRIGAYVRKGLW